MGSLNRPLLATLTAACTIAALEAASAAATGSGHSPLEGSDQGLPSVERSLAYPLLSSTLDDSPDSDGASSSYSTYIFFVLLALQAGCQPILVKVFMPETIVRSTAVMGQEGAKFVISFSILAWSGEMAEALAGWTLQSAFLAAGLPAGLFVIQNYCNIAANQILPPVTFATLNQTKTLSTALCCFLIMGQQQSPIQMLALLLLIVAALIVQKILNVECVIERLRFLKVKKKKDRELLRASSSGTLRMSNPDSVDMESPENENEPLISDEKKTSEKIEASRQFTKGVVPALTASFLSGLAGTLTQQTLQYFKRSPHVFNIELAIFSTTFLLLSFATGSPDYQKIKEGGFCQGWTWKTWIPIITNGLGGILVGLVTKYQGAVVKGFAMIFAMIISGVSQQLLFGKEGGGVTKEQFLGGSLGALSLYLHMSYPPS